MDLGSGAGMDCFIAAKQAGDHVKISVGASWRCFRHEQSWRRLCVSVARSDPRDTCLVSTCGRLSCCRAICRRIVPSKQFAAWLSFVRTPEMLGKARATAARDKVNNVPGSKCRSFGRDRQGSGSWTYRVTHIAASIWYHCLERRCLLNMLMLAVAGVHVHPCGASQSGSL